MIIVKLYRIGENGTRKRPDMIDEHKIFHSLVEHLGGQFADEYLFEIKTTIQRIDKNRKQKKGVGK